MVSAGITQGSSLIACTRLSSMSWSGITLLSRG
jgi:hypothetical protein